MPLPLEYRSGPLRLRPQRALAPLGAAATIAAVLITVLLSVAPGILAQTKDFDQRNMALSARGIETGTLQLGDRPVLVIFDPAADQPSGSAALREEVKSGDSEIALLANSLVENRPVTQLDHGLVVRPSELVLVTNSDLASTLVGPSTAASNLSVQAGTVEVLLAGVLVLLPTFYVVGSAVVFSVAFRQKQLSLLRLLGMDARRVKRLASLQVAITAGLGGLVAMILQFGALSILDNVTIGPFDFTADQLKASPIAWLAVPGTLALVGFLASAQALSHVSADPLGVSIGAREEAPARHLWIATVPLGLLAVFVGARGLRSGVSASASILVALGLVLTAASIVGCATLVLSRLRRIPTAHPTRRWAFQRLQRQPRSSLRPAAGTLVGIVLTIFVAFAAFTAPSAQDPRLSLLRVQLDTTTPRLLEEVRDFEGVEAAIPINYSFATVEQRSAFLLIAGPCAGLELLAGTTIRDCELGQVWSSSAATAAAVGDEGSDVDIKGAGPQYGDAFDGQYNVGGDLAALADAEDAIFVTTSEFDPASRSELLVESSGGVRTFLSLSSRFSQFTAGEMTGSVAPVGSASSRIEATEFRSRQMLLLGTSGALVVSSFGLVIHAITVRWYGERELRLMSTLGASRKELSLSMLILTIAPIVIGIGLALIVGLLMGSAFNLAIGRTAVVSISSLLPLGVSLLGSIVIGAVCSHLLTKTVSTTLARVDD
jgi:hypothetical protein